MPTKLHDTVIGCNTVVPTRKGMHPYINLDNAASTPAFRSVAQAVQDYLPWYSSVHRGNGLKSRLSTEVYEQARQVIRSFVGAHPDEHEVIFGKNTTEAINKLAYRMRLRRSDIVLVSNLEHHSNDLPWRAKATTKRIPTLPTGEIDRQEYVALLQRHKGYVRLVALSGASNVTGHVPDIHWFAEQAHSVGARILVDCAQLAAHRPINMRLLNDPKHLDYIAISGHKMYAPFGSGALIGRKDTFMHGAPEYQGGGTVSVVTPATVDWALPPDREEAGSPNVVGAVTLAKAIKELQAIGLDIIQKHETKLTRYALQKLSDVHGLELYGDTEPQHAAARLGVIPFTLTGVPPHLVAAVLGYEWGIGVRSGCFCAQPYVMSLLGIDSPGMQRVRYHILHNRRDLAPGMTRISIGLYNTKDDIDTLVKALQAISGGDYGKYTVDQKTGQYLPEDYVEDLDTQFAL